MSIMELLELLELLKQLSKQLSSGILYTVEIFLVTLLFSLPLGLIVAFGRISKIKIIRFLTSAYISIVRGTPLLLQLMVVYFGPYFIFGIPLSKEYRLIATFIGFSINYAAYFAEIYRGGIESMSPGQYEAAQVLGYNKTQTFFHIIFPQVIKRILPSVTNEIITLVKDTSLASVISVSELFTEAQRDAAARTSLTAFVVAGIFYYIFNLIVALGMEKIEKKMNYYH